MRAVGSARSEFLLKCEEPVARWTGGPRGAESYARLAVTGITDNHLRMPQAALLRTKHIQRAQLNTRNDRRARRPPGRGAAQRSQTQSHHWGGHTLPRRVSARIRVHLSLHMLTHLARSVTCGLRRCAAPSANAMRALRRPSTLLSLPLPPRPAHLSRAWYTGPDEAIGLGTSSPTALSGGPRSR